LTRLAAAAVAAVLLLAGCASGNAADSGAIGNVSLNGQKGWNGTPLTSGYPLPDLPFTDTSGTTVSLSDEATTPVTLVFFGYTHCPDICNVVLANVASALRGSPPAVRSKVRLVFVTTDPARDTPRVNREYLDRFDPRFEGLTAPVDTVAKAADALHVSYEKPDGTTGGNYEVEHGTYTTGFLRGRARVLWADTTTVAQLRADLARLAKLA
jgi:protein SCO1/2